MSLLRNFVLEVNIRIYRRSLILIHISPNWPITYKLHCFVKTNWFITQNVHRFHQDVHILFESVFDIVNMQQNISVE
jgi:hypothetical protein